MKFDSSVKSLPNHRYEARASTLNRWLLIAGKLETLSTFAFEECEFTACDLNPTVPEGSRRELMCPAMCLCSSNRFIPLSLKRQLSNYVTSAKNDGSNEKVIV